MAGPPAKPPLEVSCSPGLVPWLESEDLSLVFTTYQSCRLFFVGRKDGGYARAYCSAGQVLLHAEGRTAAFALARSGHLEARPQVVEWARRGVFCRVHSTESTPSNTIDTMPELDILEIAATWSFWDRPVPMSVPREIDLPSALRDSLCLAIQGVRRCGKSTLLQQLIARYRLDPERCVLLNFEDPRLARAQSFTTLDQLVERFRERHGNTGPLYFFLDEIQGVEGWQRWLRAQLDRPRGNVFVIAGSNARLLSGELSSVLTGRHLTVELFPFDLDERRRSEPEITLEQFLTDGGFPEPLVMEDGDRLRRQYFHDIVERDVRERIGARSSAAIRQVVQMAYESAGSEMSLRRLAGATGIAVDTAGGYLEACEAAYLLFACPYFAFSERKRASRNRKYYPIDTGLRRVVVTRGGADRGKSLECATYLALRRRFGEVFYWREEGEVDFVVAANGHIVPIQVVWAEPLDRHHRALQRFYERHPQAEEAVFVTGARFRAALSLTELRTSPDRGAMEIS